MKTQSCPSRGAAQNQVLRILVLSLAVILSQASVFARPQKVKVSDPIAAATLKAQGARLLADYGSFQLYESATPPSAGTFKADQIEADNEADLIELNAGALDTRAPAVLALRKTVTPFGGKKLHLVQFVGPVKPEWREALEATGVAVIHYIPQNAYLVRGDSAAIAKLQAWAQTADYLQWEGEYANDYKIQPRARLIDAKGNPVTPTTDVFAIQMVADAAANAATLVLIDQLKLEPSQQEYQMLDYLNVVVRIPPEQVATLAAQPEVVSIRPYVQRKRRDERQGQIMAGNLAGNLPNGPGYLAWLASKGFTQEQFDASGFVVDITDSGIDNGTTNAGHFGLYKTGVPGMGTRVAYNRLEGSPHSGSTLAGCDGHGNINAHIIGGFNDVLTSPHLDVAGYHYGLGICPFVKVGSSVIFDPSSFTSPSYPNLAARAYRDGARVSNNSWGASVGGDYDTDSQAYDALVRDAQPSGSAVATAGNQQMVFCFAAGNDGPGGGTIGSPGTAKNVLVVGAAENVHSHATANGGNSAAGNDGCSTPDSEANSAADIASFSSRGPCTDGRQKPDLVAPGTHITGGVAQNILTTNGTGAAISCFDAEGVCALPGGGSAGNANNFFPLGQQFYSTSSGTSHSTPAVAGAAALLRQYFINATLTPPSPAMTKAFLVNAARYMTGTYANDTLPSPNQGMGSVNLGMAFDGVSRVLRDQRNVDKFTASGQTRTITGSVVDPTKPFRVTLAWTDAPGSTTGNAYNNNLDVTVTIGGNTYKGNVFSGGTSITGGTADVRNNLESIFLPAGVSGVFVVTITAANINSDGVPNEAPTVDQDFALVIYNAVEAQGPAVSSVGYALATENCDVPNGVVDPGETVTINFALQNFGTADTTNLIATLLPINGVMAPSAAQSYGALVANGGAVTQAFSFTANGICGSNIVATFELTDGAVNYAQVAINIPLGQFVPIYSENFDGVAAPALPSGWSTSGSGGQIAWVTTSTASDTAPYAAYSPDATTQGANALVSATYALPTGPSQLSFRHRYGFETGWDGGVLEMKIGGGNFADIITAGGSFVSGGYNNSVTSGNALGARSVWGGTNANFSTVLVSLPGAASGQSVQFRWRAGTDASIGGAGWWVDTVTINAMSCCTGGEIAPIITNQPQSQLIAAGGPASLSVGAVGTAPLHYQWFANNASILDATNDSYVIPAVTVGDAGDYFAVITNTSGSATSSIATLTVVATPIILTNPVSQNVSIGNPASFSVTAFGAAPLTYQWRFNGNVIPNATNATFAITSVLLSDSGTYAVVVTNFAGAITSAPVSLTVSVTPVVLAGWDVSGQTNFGVSPLGPTTNAANISVTGLTRGAGVATSVTAASGGAWGGNGFNANTFDAAVTSADYLIWAIAPNTGYTASFASVSRFDYRRSASGPPTGVLQYQVGTGGAFINIATNAFSSSASSGVSLPAIDLSGIAALQNVGPGTNVTFRLVNYGGSNPSGTWYIYNVANSAAPDLAISGTIMPVAPPPAIPPSLMLLSVTGNQIQFTLTGTPSAQYVIEVATNINGAVWSPVHTGAAPILFTEPATNDQRYYRGRIAP